MEALGLNLGYIFVQILNFAVVFVVLRAWVYQPILGLLDRRRQAIAQGLEDARQAAEARANAEKEAAAIVAEAQVKASQLVREATEKADVVARDLKSAAEAEAAKVRSNSLAEAQSERERILSDLRGQVAGLSMAAAQRLIGQSVDEHKQHAIINEFFSGVRGGQIVVPCDPAASGESAEITSALPLTNDEKAAIQQDVLSKIGSQGSISFRVDPLILGGLIIRVGDKVLDSSVAGQLDMMRQSLS